jgi:hypothetical protein
MTIVRWAVTAAQDLTEARVLEDGAERGAALIEDLLPVSHEEQTQRPAGPADQVPVVERRDDGLSGPGGGGAGCSSETLGQGASGYACSRAQTMLATNADTQRQEPASPRRSAPRQSLERSSLACWISGLHVA